MDLDESPELEVPRQYPGEHGCTGLNLRAEVEAGNLAHELLLNPQKKMHPPERAEKGRRRPGAEPQPWSPEGGVKSRERCVQNETRLSTVKESWEQEEMGMRTKVEVASAAPGTQTVSSILAVFYPLAIMWTITEVTEVMNP